jgi:hypothetical protein
MRDISKEKSRDNMGACEIFIKKYKKINLSRLVDI